ncbi:hypothetical protein N8I84_21640 [Streptomyces cynarae]|uniref:O-antigen ligase family protein n=1 Tax=Streptomyces cynarae TaxID=2981134 RepID=A0ABY6EAB0_9ACTN|nr:hypothetical protein [Streptomyces cynarae]UXY20998.1 hypothetical protein N8I84_21640 [Streptomyces cynarae]
MVAVLMAPDIGCWIKARRENRTLAVLLCCWFLSQAVSNLWAGISPGHAVLKAFTFPALTAVGVFVFSRLSYGTVARVAALTVAASIGYCVFLETYSSRFFQQDPWKYGLGIPVTIVIAVAAGWLRQKMVPLAAVVLLAAVSMFHLTMGFRSLAAICLVVTGLLLVRRPDRSLTLPRATFLAAASLLAVWISCVIITGAISRGWLGQEQYRKQAYQSQVEGGYLVAARPELIVSSKIIAEQPFLGRGSEASLTPHERREAAMALDERGFNLSLNEQHRLFGNGVNSHSIALGSWVSGGILACAPWIFFLLVLYRAVMRKWSGRETLLYPVTLFMALLMSWDFLFSPWSPGYEVILGIAWSLALGAGNKEQWDRKAA